MDDPQTRSDKFKQNELIRYQRKYKNLMAKTKPTKTEYNKKKYLLKQLEMVSKDRDRIKLKLKVATGRTHLKVDEENLKKLEKNVKLKEILQQQIDETCTEIKHLQMQLKRVENEKQIVLQIALSDNQYRLNLRKAKRMRKTLDDNVCVAKRKEATLATENHRLHDIITNMIWQRKLFNKLWLKFVFQLSHDKKFLIDLVEGAVMAFNKGTDLCTKVSALRENSQREKRLHIQEMIEINRKLDADKIMHKFLGGKGLTRKLQPLEPREYLRRSTFKNEYFKKLKQFTRVLEKVKKISETDDISMAMLKFNKQEHEYFSHFNYMNELNNQVEFLNESLRLIYGDIDQFRTRNENKLFVQENQMRKLTDTLQAEKMKALDIEQECRQNDETLTKYMTVIYDIFKLLRCSDTELETLITTDHTNVTIFNIEKFLEILQTRLNTVLNYVYYAEAKAEEESAKLPDEERKPPVIRIPITKISPEPTNINDIVLVQQCAECAEGEDVNRYDEETVWPNTKEVIRKKTIDKVEAPEMQMRLHTLSKCKLPKSRALVNKRYQ